MTIDRILPGRFSYSEYGGSIVDRRERLCPSKSVGGDHASAILEPKRRQIAENQADVFAILFDEDRASRSTAQRFQTERAGAGEKIDHEEIGHRLAKDVEDRLADEVARRPSRPSLGSIEFMPSALAGDNAHVGNPHPRRK